MNWFFNSYKRLSPAWLGTIITKTLLSLRVSLYQSDSLAQNLINQFGKQYIVFKHVVIQCLLSQHFTLITIIRPKFRTTFLYAGILLQNVNSSVISSLGVYTLGIALAHPVLHDVRPSMVKKNTSQYMVKSLGQLVLVSFIHYCTSTPSLSTL